MNANDAECEKPYILWKRTERDLTALFYVNNDYVAPQTDEDLQKRKDKLHLPSIVEKKFYNLDTQFYYLDTLEQENREIMEVLWSPNPPKAVTDVSFSDTLITEISDGILQLSRLELLRIRQSLVSVITTKITQLVCLKFLDLYSNDLTQVPREIGDLTLLTYLGLGGNKIAVIPPTLGRLKNLEYLWLQDNFLQWLPIELDLLPENTHLALSGNKCAIHTIFGCCLSPQQCLLARPCSHDYRYNGLQEIFEKTTHIGMIRERAAEIAIGLQSLGLPAFVTLQIIKQSFPRNRIRMWAKWELITAVKHFRDRH